MAKIVSLSTVTVTITNPYYEQIVIGGGGKLVGQVSMRRNNSSFSVVGSPDGGYAGSFSKNRTGEVSIQLSQASSLISRLTKFIIWCEQNPRLAESSISVDDQLGNIVGTGNGVFPAAIPDNTVGESATSRTFTFMAGEVIFDGGDE